MACRLHNMRTMLRTALTTHKCFQRKGYCNRYIASSPTTARSSPNVKHGRPIGSFVTRALHSDLAAEDARAQAYYDSDDAYNFYKDVWGGDNIHVGLYGGIDHDIIDEGDNDEASRIRQASQRSLERLFALQPPTEGSHVMDMGAAYGGLARWCVNTYQPALFSCVELSAKENARYWPYMRLSLSVSCTCSRELIISSVDRDHTKPQSIVSFHFKSLLLRQTTSCPRLN